MLTNSTLRLEADKQTVNYINAWSVGQPSKSSATVTIIKYEGKVYLITNAHAVANTTYLKVKFNQGSTELPVKAVWVDPIMDVAILKATSTEAENSILKKVEPLDVNTEFQSASTEVNAYGYPSGGKGLSFTKGHISRIEISQIAYSRLPGITVQTSAPINPGNSGGPITRALATGKEQCIGIVSQGNSSLSNVGYFIPACTVIQVIENYKKFGKLRAKQWIDYVTVPQVSFEWQSLKNPSLRMQLGMKSMALDEELTGIYVTNVPKSSSASNRLQEGDIILAIDNHPIQADGNVKVKELEHPISFLYLLQRKKYLDNMEFCIQRKNENGVLETKTVTIKLNEQLGRSILGAKDDKALKYHIQPSGKNGGFVFVRCTQTLMDTFKQSYATGQRTIIDNSNVPSMFKEFSELSTSKELHEIVVLQSILASEETDGYENFALNRGLACESHRIIQANGKPISSLWDLVSALTSEPQKPSSVKFANGKMLVIAPETQSTRQELQQRYQIAFFTSPQVAPFLGSDPTSKRGLPSSLREKINALENDNGVVPSMIQSR
ncbi:S1C family serine protease [Legionella hackeliae]|uniref:Putative rSerine protease-like protein n=1 Tax=Legionella hackeliae TaxID=449 RepID=A0A0A8ULB6_LEGHA|nr:S1C family serine protease [Legionella hackeliae]KTD14851.1 DegP protease (Do-like, S2-serine-like) [Legionella hackeliae]CEK09523.1 Putative rSerine protease-like protein [Legionella hackeliae]STX49430.1 DegP protease (Do-like, S2-serine-like) [Legionella hackeliae]